MPLRPKVFRLQAQSTSMTFCNSNANRDALQRLSPRPPDQSPPLIIGRLGPCGWIDSHGHSVMIAAARQRSGFGHLRIRHNGGQAGIFAAAPAALFRAITAKSVRRHVQRCCPAVAAKPANHGHGVESGFPPARATNHPQIRAPANQIFYRSQLDDAHDVF